MPAAMILALIETGLKVADRVISIIEDQNGSVTIIEYSRTTSQKIDELLTKIDARLNQKPS